MHQEDFAQIEGFWEYTITSCGRVINNNTGRELALTEVRGGELTVGLMRHGKTHRRSVKRLIAEAFVEGEDEINDTPVLLDGRKDNLYSSNIVWRPRWLAWKYSQQFKEPQPHWYLYGPIYDIIHNDRYDSVIDASMITGQLAEDIFKSTQEGTMVYPMGSLFVFI